MNKLIFLVLSTCILSVTAVADDSITVYDACYSEIEKTYPELTSEQIFGLLDLADTKQISEKSFLMDMDVILCRVNYDSFGNAVAEVFSDDYEN